MHAGPVCLESQARVHWRTDATRTVFVCTRSSARVSQSGLVWCGAVRCGAVLIRSTSATTPRTVLTFKVASFNATSRTGRAYSQDNSPSLPPLQATCSYEAHDVVLHGHRYPSSVLEPPLYPPCIRLASCPPARCVGKRASQRSQGAKGAKPGLEWCAVLLLQVGSVLSRLLPDLPRALCHNSCPGRRSGSIVDAVPTRSPAQTAFILVFPPSSEYP